MTWSRGWFILLVGLLAVSACNPPTKKKRSSAAIKEDVASSFEKLKEAISELRKDNTEKFWNSLSVASQKDAAKKAKAFRADFAKREKEEQEDIAQQLGATPEQLRDRLSDYGYVRIMREELYARYWMIAEAPIDYVKLDSEDEATVFYIPDDAERDKRSVLFVLEEDGWKADLKIP